MIKKSLVFAAIVLSLVSLLNCSRSNESNESNETTVDSVSNMSNHGQFNSELISSQKLSSYYTQVRNRITESGEVISVYDRSWEHSKDAVEYKRYKEFKLLSEESELYSNDQHSIDLYFRNDSLLAVWVRHTNFEDKTFDETVAEFKNGVGYTYEREIADILFSKSSEGDYFENSKILDSASRKPFVRKLLVKSTDYEEEINALLAKFDPRMPSQELLGESSEEEDKAIASQDSINRLTYLDLAGKGLKELPVEATAKTEVTQIDLNSNRLTNFPLQLNQLTNLASLNLSGNKIEVIPASIAEFENLEALYLDNNELQALPLEMTKLKNLRYLSLVGNKFSLQQQREIRAMFTNTNCVVSFAVNDSAINGYQIQ